MNPDLTSPSGKRSHDDVSPDIEDLGQRKRPTQQPALPVVSKHVTTPSQKQLGPNGSWRSVLGEPPERGTTRVSGCG